MNASSTFWAADGLEGIQVDGTTTAPASEHKTGLERTPNEETVCPPHLPHSRKNPPSSCGVTGQPCGESEPRFGGING